MKILPNALSLSSLLAGALLLAAPAHAQTVLSCSADGAGCPTRIPDAGAAKVATVTVAAGACGAFNVRSMGARVQVTHAHAGDLRLTLRDPLSRTFTLMQRPRTEAGAAVGSCFADDINATFSDAGTGGVVCGTSIPGIQGHFVPVTGMIILADAPLQTGEWELEVQDFAAGGDGELTDWQLLITCDLPDEIFDDGFEDPT